VDGSVEAAFYSGDGGGPHRSRRCVLGWV